MAAKSKGKSELLAGWYELKGPYWALPIKLTWIGQTDVAALEVAPRLNLPNIMRKAATDRLKELGADFYHDYWWLVRTVCEQFLKPIYGDPEEVIEWTPVWKIPYRVPSPENRNQTEFYHEFAKLGWVKSALAAEVLWKAFMQHCLHWLMNERKPVDMLFAELCAFPVRPNWLALVWYWDRTKKVSGTDTRKYRWARWMLDQKLNFFDPEQKVFQWSLNVRPDEAWWDAVAKYERRLKAKVNWLWMDYLPMIRESAKRALPIMFRFYGTYISQLRYPFVGNKPKRALERLVSPEDDVPRGAQASFDQTLPAAFWPRDHGKKRSLAEFLLARQRKMGGLPDLPPVQPEVPDVRDTGAAVGASPDPPNGANGVPVLDAAGGVGPV